MLKLLFRPSRVRHWHQGSTATACGLAAVACMSVLMPASAQEKARPADSFVDSLAVSGTYAVNTNAQTYADFNSYGFRHVRLDANANSSVINNAYAQYGIKNTVLVDQNKSVANNIALIRGFNVAALDAVEGPNEADNTAIGGIGASAGASFQASLYSQLKADTTLRSVPVLNLTIINTNNIPAITSDNFDFENWHTYPGPNPPLTGMLNAQVGAGIPAIFRAQTRPLRAELRGR